MSYPFERNRILRKSPSIREAIAETHLSVSHLLLPIFLIPGEDDVSEISSMPGVYRYTLDRVNALLQEAYDHGIRQVLLFAQVEEHLKDNAGTEALNPDGLMQQGIRHVKSAFPDMVVMTDVALDPCSSYGHDGIVVDGTIVNDATVEVLCAMALSHVEAGADWVAPSDMMDGRIGSLRECLNDHGYHEVGILATRQNTRVTCTDLSAMRSTPRPVLVTRRRIRWTSATPKKPFVRLVRMLKKAQTL